MHIVRKQSRKPHRNDANRPEPPTRCEPDRTEPNRNRPGKLFATRARSKNGARMLEQFALSRICGATRRATDRGIA
eukprot:597854-Lingulodinium_polyedra.AAC.1